jgi:hypothetical protein
MSIMDRQQAKNGRAKTEDSSDLRKPVIATHL